MSVKLKCLFGLKFRRIQVESAITLYPKTKLQNQLQICSSIFIPLCVKVDIAFNKNVYCGLPNWQKEKV